MSTKKILLKMLFHINFSIFLAEILTVGSEPYFYVDLLSNVYKMLCGLSYSNFTRVLCKNIVKLL